MPVSDVLTMSQLLGKSPVGRGFHHRDLHCSVLFSIPLR